MKVVNKNEEKMFGRTSLTISMEKVGTTPSRAELQKKIADLEKTNAKLVVVTDITTITGTANIEIKAESYADEGSYKLHVPEYLAKRSEVKEEVKEEAAPAAEEAAPAEEAPAEEKAEEPAKEEEKKEGEN